MNRALPQYPRSVIKLTLVLLQDIVETLPPILLAQVRFAFSFLFEFSLNALPVVIALYRFIVCACGDKAGRHFDRINRDRLRIDYFNSGDSAAPCCAVHSSEDGCGRMRRWRQYASNWVILVPLSFSQNARLLITR